jgi:hypothetical protein
MPVSSVLKSKPVRCCEVAPVSSAGVGNLFIRGDHTHKTWSGRGPYKVLLLTESNKICQKYFDLICLVSLLDILLIKLQYFLKCWK